MLRVWADVILHPHFFLLASSIFPCSTCFHGQSPKASKTCSKLFPMAYSCSTRSWHRHLIKKPEYLRAHMSTNRRDCGDCAKKNTARRLTQPFLWIPHSSVQWSALLIPPLCSGSLEGQPSYHERRVESMAFPSETPSRGISGSEVRLGADNACKKPKQAPRHARRVVVHKRSAYKSALV